MDLEKEIEQYKRVYAEINLDAIRNNMDHMKDNLEPETQMIGVIKTDGYGHGAIPIARELEPLSYVFGFATATVEEALILRKSGIKKPLLILGYTFPYCYNRLAEEEIRPAVFSYDTARQLSHAALSAGKAVKIHIKVDTGMSRIGVRPDQSGIDCIAEIGKLKGIEIEGIFTHFARADEADKTAAICQLTVFREFVHRLSEETGIIIPFQHCSNSAGIVELKEANMDLVRAGITLYGLWPSEQVSKETVRLEPALQLFSHIVYIKELKEGAAISYGGTYVADKPIKVATIPVGYGDGYPRDLSNKGYVLLHGKKAPVLGRICMDQFMVDVTGIPEAAEGDRVVLIGSDGGLRITVEELERISGRFNYELVCDLGKRVPRVYKKEGKIVGTKDYFEDYK